MTNKTISLPDDVVPIIDALGMPFSRWVTEQLRRHSAQMSLSLGQQLMADAQLTRSTAPSDAEARATGERMERSAPW